jgi:hypothetical protein
LTLVTQPTGLGETMSNQPTASEIARYARANGLTLTAAMRHLQRAAAGVAIAGVLSGAAIAGSAIGSADPSEHVTVDGTLYPVCSLEDCSDQAAQVGVWFDPDTGNAWLSLGDYSVPVTR